MLHGCVADRKTPDDGIPSFVCLAPSQPTKTSENAARLITPKANALRQQVARELKRRTEAGEIGATDEELDIFFGWGLNTTRPRRVELRDRGYVADSGHERTNKSGRPATVWTWVGPPDADVLSAPISASKHVQGLWVHVEVDATALLAPGALADRIVALANRRGDPHKIRVRLLGYKADGAQR